MKRLMCAIAWVGAGVLASQIAALSAEEKEPLVVVRGPTVVAFCKPVTPAELDKDADANEVLSDFQLYARNVREPFAKAGIEFHGLYVDSFRVRVGKILTKFRPVDADVGYYFIAPGKKPRILYGVATDRDLLQTANEYFGFPQNEPGPAGNRPMDKPKSNGWRVC